MDKFDIDIDFPKMVRKFKNFNGHYTEFEFNGLKISETPKEFINTLKLMYFNDNTIMTLVKALKYNLGKLYNNNSCDSSGEILVDHKILSYINILGRDIIHTHQYKISKTNKNKEFYCILFEVGDNFTNIFLTYNDETILIFDSKNVKDGNNLLFLLIYYFVESWIHGIKQLQWEKSKRVAGSVSYDVDKIINSMISHGETNEIR